MTSNRQAVPKRIGAILLAAGNSSRLGRPKQQLIIEGKSLLVHTAEALRGAELDHVVVVVGHEAEVHEKTLAHLKIECLRHTDWHLGMGSSIKAGLRHLLGTVDLDAAIITACDQPMISSGHLINMKQAYLAGTEKIVASTYGNTAGIPILFDRAFFPRMLTIDDSRGAKKLIEDELSLLRVPFPGGEIDVDTESDYEKALNRVRPRAGS